MRYLSLFSGIEACTVAWHPLGWEPVAFAEIEAFPSAVLAHHYPDVPNLGDVTGITEDTLRDLGPIDLVVGGSPCQDLSVAGKRAGFDGERSSLFFEQWRIFNAARHVCGARYLLWENVPGAFSSNEGRDFAAVVNTMAGASIAVPDDGWGTEGMALGEHGLLEWCVLDAQWFGVAQRRRRVFALLDVGDWTDRPPILLEPESLRGDFAPCRETGKGVAGYAAGSIGGYSAGIGTVRANGGDLREGSETLAVQPYPVANPLTARMHKGINTTLDEGQTPVVHIDGTDTARTLRAEHDGSPEPDTGFDVVAFHNRQDPDVSGDLTHPLGAQDNGMAIAFSSKDHGADATEECSPTLRASVHRDSTPNGGAPPAVAFYSNEGSQGNSFPPEVSPPVKIGSSGSGNPPAVCFQPRYARNGTSGGGKPGQGYPAVRTGMQVRRLTPRECERLQGVPDDYTRVAYRNKPADKCPDGPRYRALGNSMAVPCMAWIGRKMIEALLGATA